MSIKESKDIERRSTQIGQIFADKEDFNHPNSFHFSLLPDKSGRIRPDRTPWQAD